MPQTQSKHPSQSVPGLLSGDLAAALRTTPRTLTAWEKSGRIPPSIRIGRRRLWPAGTVERLLAAHAGGAQ